MKGLTGTAFPARLRWVLLLFALMLLALLAKLLDVQWLQRDSLLQEIEQQTVRDQPIFVPRGMIVDRNGAPLAVSTPLYWLQAGRLLWESPRTLKRSEKRSLCNLAKALGYATPLEAKDNKPARICKTLSLAADEFVKRIEEQGGRARWEELAVALGEQPEALRRRLENVGPGKRMEGETEQAFKDRVNKIGTRNAYPLALRLPPEQAKAVLALKIPDIVAKQGYRRYYPSGEVATQLIGRVSDDGQGKEGLERMFDSWLSGTAGTYRILKDGRGGVFDDLGMVQPPQPGKDLQLSIDLRLQTLASLELSRALQKNKATWGSAVLVDVTSGEILALANQPSYNPNDPAAYSAAAARNHALLDNMEPGSAVKPLSMLAALQSGRWKPTDKVNLLNAAGKRELMVKCRRTPIKDVAIGGPDEPDLTQILIESSNIGISKIALDIGAEPIRQVMQRFGFGRASLRFPAEQLGKLPAHERWCESETTNLAYGYGLEVTVMQLAQAYAAIANDGRMLPLTLLRQSEPAKGEQVIDKAIAKTVRGMLQQVVHASRAPSLARIEGYQVAGKSGTADKNEAGKQGKTRALFAGFAPADAPRFALVVVFDEPEKVEGQRTAHFGGAVAAPVFSKVMGKTLRLLQVPPDSPAVQLAGAPR